MLELATLLIGATDVQSAVGHTWHASLANAQLSSILEIYVCRPLVDNNSKSILPYNIYEYFHYCIASKMIRPKTSGAEARNQCRPARRRRIETRNRRRILDLWFARKDRVGTVILP